MSEYQRHEFMTVDRPLTKEQMARVNRLSSHIEVSATHAVVEYYHGDFSHEPIEVLRKFFDGYLYWANWGSPQLALRFPHGALPANFIEYYDFDEFVTFTTHEDYDILNIEFPEMEGPDEWAGYSLESIIHVRHELLEGDLRPLYIVWLAAQRMIGTYDAKDEDYEDEDGEGDELRGTMPIPPGLDRLTTAQEALAEFFEVPQTLLLAVAQHSEPVGATPDDDFAAWVRLLPDERRNDYLVRLAHNELGLSRALIQELREVGGKKREMVLGGKRVTYATLLAESKAVQARQERERREEVQRTHERQMQYAHDHQDEYWQKIDKAAALQNSGGYDEALRLLIELRQSAELFKEEEQFQARFRPWLQGQARRPALLKRLKTHKFPALPV